MSEKRRLPISELLKLHRDGELVSTPESNRRETAAREQGRRDMIEKIINEFFGDKEHRGGGTIDLLITEIEKARAAGENPKSTLEWKVLEAFYNTTYIQFLGWSIDTGFATVMFDPLQHSTYDKEVSHGTECIVVHAGCAMGGRNNVLYYPFVKAK